MDNTLDIKGATLETLDDERAYEDELAVCAGVTGFHRWFFLNALAQGLGLRFSAVRVELEGVALGVVPLVLRQRGPISKLNDLPVPYVGPVSRTGDPALLAISVRQRLLRERIVVTKWAFAPAVEVDQTLLQVRGFDMSLETNFVIRSRVPLEERWNSLSAGTRRMLRQLEAVDTEFAESDYDEVLEWLPELIAEPYIRQGVGAIYSPAAARAMAELLAGHPRMQWRSVRADGKLLVLVGNIVEADRVWGWQILGRRTPGLNTHALAYWYLIQEATRVGIDLDLAGAPNDGIRQFKQRFRPEEENSVTAVKIRPRAYTSVRGIYMWMANKRR